MSIFNTELQSEKKGNFKSFITLFLKPNDPNNENEKYRFRILNYITPEKNDRKAPFISRYVHNHWGTSDNGVRIVDDTVVCPSSAFINAREDETLGFTEKFRELKLKEKKFTWSEICPCCQHVGEAWNSYKSSGKTDKIAQERISQLSRVFQGIVPVYVIHDPINPKNDGKFKCIIFSDPDEYKAFLDIVNRERAKIRMGGNQYRWCNGDNAVDFYLRMEKVPVVWNEGKANQREGFKRKITRMAFGTKAYDLRDNDGMPIITQDAIDKFEFDEQYYVKSTMAEIEDFYKRHYAFVNKNIPTEEEDVFSDSTPIVKKSVNSTAEPSKPVVPAEEKTIPQNPTVKKITVADEDINDLLADPDDLPPPQPVQPKSAPIDDDTNMDDLMKELNFND